MAEQGVTSCIFFLNRVSGFDIGVACPDGELAQRLTQPGYGDCPFPDGMISHSPRLTMVFGTNEERETGYRPHTEAFRAHGHCLRRSPAHCKHGQVRVPTPEGYCPPQGPSHDSSIELPPGLSDKVIAVSEGVRRELEESGINPSMITAIPNGIDVGPYKRKSRRSPRRVDVSDGTDKREFLIGTLARLSPQKGIDTLVEAAKIVVASCPTARFVIGGTGPLESDLRTKIRDLRLEPYVRMPGFVEEVPEFLAGLDLYVLPSDSEGIGLAIIEAMAAGLPVVATRVGGVPEAVVDGETGFLVPPRQPKALAQAIVRLLVDPDLAKYMGASGRARAEAMFDAKTTAEKTVGVYKDVLASRRKRRQASYGTD